MQQQLLHLQSGLRVERAERLVHQEELGLHQQAAREADTLLHAAGELVGIGVLEAAEADQGERAFRLLLEAAPLVALDARAERDVVAHRQPGEERRLLEPHRAVGARPSRRAAVESEATPPRLPPTRAQI